MKYSPVLRFVTLTIACLFAHSITTNVHAQQIVQGTPVSLPNQQLMIVGVQGEKLVVLKVFNSDDKTKQILDIAAGDIIVAIGDKPTKTLEQFNQTYEAVPTNGNVELKIQRETKKRSVKFKKAKPRFVLPKNAIAPPGNWKSAGGTKDGDEKDRSKKNHSDQDDPGGQSKQIELQQQLSTLLHNSVQPNSPGMVVGVQYHGKTVFLESAGLANLELQTPLTKHNVFPIASLSKQFTGYATALLVTRNQLDLDQTIDHWLPEIKLGKRIKLRQLLDHTSGLKDYTGLMSLTGWRYGNDIDSSKILQLISKQTTLDFQPGSQHRYSNTNYALIPIIVERASGKSFKEFLEQEVFKKLEMSATSLPNTGRDIIANRATTYRTDNNQFACDFGTHGAPGSGGIFSNAADMLKWGQELIRVDQLDQKAVSLMTIPGKLPDGNTLDYAMGIGVAKHNGHTRLSHSGSTPGSSSVLHVYPGSKLAVVVLANYSDANVYDLAESIASTILPASENQPNPQPSGRPAGAMMLTEEDFNGTGLEKGKEISDQMLQSIAGRYVLADERELIFESSDGNLKLKIRPDIPGVPLVHLGNGRFRFTPGRWELSFDISSTPVQKMTLHLLEDSIRRGPPGNFVGHRKDLQKPTPAMLSQLTGTYYSDELNTAYDIVLEHDHLVLRHPQMGTLPLEHYSNDTFGLPGRGVSLLRFQRKKSASGSSVTGLIAEAYAWSTTATFKKMESER